MNKVTSEDIYIRMVEIFRKIMNDNGLSDTDVTLVMTTIETDLKKFVEIYSRAAVEFMTEEDLLTDWFEQSLIGTLNSLIEFKAIVLNSPIINEAHKTSFH